MTLSDGTVLPRNTEVGEVEVRMLAADAGVDRVRVRSVLTCDSLSDVNATQANQPLTRPRIARSIACGVRGGSTAIVGTSTGTAP